MPVAALGHLVLEQALSVDAMFSLAFTLFATLLPLCIWVMLAPSRTFAGRFTSFGVAFALLYGLHCLRPLDPKAAQQLVLSVTYLATVAAIFELVRRISIAGRGYSLTVFLLAEAAFVLVPALLFRGTTAGALTVLGFDFALSAFSYSVDATRTGEADLSEALHFILVNPVLLFRDRGRGGAAVKTGAGLARCGLGILTLAVGLLLVAPLVGEGPQWHGNPAAWIRGGAGVLLSFYLAHSGVASLRIGAMALCGHRIPERYRQPLLATGPRDFWRRWNTYFNRWVEWYVYLPLARRTRRFSSPYVADCVGILSAFAVSGTLHELVVFARRGAPSGDLLLGFILAGSLGAAASALTAVLRRSGPAPMRMRAIEGLAGWTATIPIAAAIAAVIVPVLGR